MASNILSRLLPSASDDDDPMAPRRSDIEALAADDLDSNDAQFEDQDLEALLAEGMEDNISLPSAARISLNKAGKAVATGQSPPVSARDARPLETITDDDDDVPESLLLEGKPDRRRRRKSRNSRMDDQPTPAPGPETRNTRIQWQATQTQQRLHGDPPPMRDRRNNTTRNPGMHQSFIVDPKQRAMWMWANVNNLDTFLKSVYNYYEEHGIYSIYLRRAISVFTAAFVGGLSTFMFFCIDYSKLPGSSRFADVRVPQCTKSLPLYWNMAIFFFFAAAGYTVFRWIQQLPALWDMHNFYLHLLDIPDKDIQTVTWQYVVAKLMELRDTNPNTALNISPANRRFISTQSKQRMDAHDIANRLMRRENFFIALINKDILDCNLDLPFFGRRSFYTRSLELNISMCLMDFVFDDNGQVKPQFRGTKRRQQLIDILRKRFFIAGVVNIFLSGPMAFWAVAIRFLRSFTEYQKNPSELSTRKFSLVAEWKIRNYNEVSHMFHRRKRMVYPFANRYLDQFPKDKTNQMMRFAAFIASALAAVLGVVTMWDPDLFLGFEIGGKTALFWLGIFGTLYVAFRGAATDEEVDDLWDPEVAMNAVIAHMQYYPDSWKDKLYSDEVRRDFSSMYKLEALLFLEDIAGVIITPLVLMWSLPRCVEQLVDFFREFTIHVDGLGTVCSFAVFDFKHGGKAQKPGQQGNDNLREAYYGDKNNKLMESYVSFLEHYGPNPTKRGLHSRKRPFHPPPTFPGINMGSPNPDTPTHTAVTHQRHAPSALRHSYQQTPRMAPSAVHMSPMHSILLDPHHQPRSSPLHGPTRTSRAATSHHHVLEDDPVEAPEETDEPGSSPSRPSNLPRTTSNLIDDDSDLAASWIVKGGEIEDDNAKRSGDIPVETNLGILGMVTHMTKPKEGGRRGHI
ncbi:autophagy protein-like protein Apg9 [Microthyrium microscopicum]|uniref:Autophagy-related protein 9 n=1 Tax=Microthyrium microscopicum TaxID=703497 RepID=A0A6A6TZM1_9PEZI|nr:autophagy protein-like protein Apg9 [Microthyrium microscopicum]